MLLGHPAVYDAIVVGVPDPRWGERVTAVVQITPGDEVDDDCVDRALPFATRGRTSSREPSSPVDAVQRSPVGKARLRVGQRDRNRRKT